MQQAQIAPRRSKGRDDKPASTAAWQIVEAAVRPETTCGRLKDLCSSDPALIVRVLALANSSAFGTAIKTTDVEHAIALLGVQGLRNVALSFCLDDMTPRGAQGDALLTVCLRRAVAARALAAALGLRNASEHFTAGMLLEVGLLVHAGRDLDQAAHLVSVPAGMRLTSERGAGLQPHPARGAELARSWNLGETVEQAIATHHAPEPPDTELGRVAWAAERVAAVFEGGELTTQRQAAIDAAMGLGLTEDAAISVLQEIPACVHEAAASFQRAVDHQPDLDELMRDANAALVEMNRSYQRLVAELEQLVRDKERLTEELKVANGRLHDLALTDELTGLGNKRAFQDALARDLARAERMGQQVSVVYFDADHFKKVNDTYGHAAGDDVLRMIGETVRATVRQGDVPGRIGGEEFAVLLPNTAAGQAVIVGERLRNKIRSAVVQGPAGPLQITASFGIAGDGGAGVGRRGDALLERADAALYEAKRSGRDRVCVAPPVG